MIIGTSALEQLVSRAVVGRKTVDEVSQDAFSAVAAAGLNSGTHRSLRKPAIRHRRTASRTTAVTTNPSHG